MQQLDPNMDEFILQTTYLTTWIVTEMNHIWLGVATVQNTTVVDMTVLALNAGAYVIEDDNYEQIFENNMRKIKKIYEKFKKKFEKRNQKEENNQPGIHNNVDPLYSIGNKLIDWSNQKIHK